MNHWPECIEIWHGTSLGQGDFVQMNSLGLDPQALLIIRTHIVKKHYSL